MQTRREFFSCLLVVPLAPLAAALPRRDPDVLTLEMIDTAVEKAKGIKPVIAEGLWVLSPGDLYLDDGVTIQLMTSVQGGTFLPLNMNNFFVRPESTARVAVFR